jgi:hypothetical protein
MRWLSVLIQSNPRRALLEVLTAGMLLSWEIAMG